MELASKLRMVGAQARVTPFLQYPEKLPELCRNLCCSVVYFQAIRMDGKRLVFFSL